MADPAADGLCELVRQARAGSNDAATAVYERCRAPLLAVIRGMLAKPLHKIEDADDLLNETFAEIFRGTLSDQALHSPETLLQYMKTVARNNVRNAIRKYLCTQRFNLRAEVPLAAAPAQKASELSPADHAMLAEFLELTDADLAEHSFASAQLITKYLFCGFEVREIAEFLHISQRHVLHLIDKAKQQLSGGGGGKWRSEIVLGFCAINDNSAGRSALNVKTTIAATCVVERTVTWEGCAFCTETCT